MNQLYYGDNLDVLRRHIADESVDLVYLDPPFNSNASYNVLFAERDGAQAASQIKAFEDTWRWDESAARAFEEVVETGGKVSQVMQAFRTFLGESDMLAYLAMMAPRLVELRRVLKPTGSLYLHCDPTASHYLKMLLDAVFGPGHFRNELVWKRTSARSDSHRWNQIHDTILFYSKSDEYVWNPQYTPYSAEYQADFYGGADNRGDAFMSDNLTAAGVRHGESGKPWRDVDPTKRGRHWALPVRVVEQLGLTGTVQERLDGLDIAGYIIWPKKQSGMPRYKRLLKDMPGLAIQSIISDISPLSAKSAERLGYPTQKPESLLERIVAASSNEGDVVLDPFCGCGTTIAAATKLNRRWIGIDVTALAISLIRSRLTDTFGANNAQYEVIGEPVSLPDAVKLAKDDPYQFQWWALGLVHARPVEQKKGADQGIDGRIYFHEGESRKTQQIIFSVKAGKLHAPYVRDLRGVVEREKAAIGVLLCLDEPTRAMKTEAASAGFYASPWGKHPRLQILTIEELLTGTLLDRPPAQASVTFKRAPKAAGPVMKGRSLDFGAATEDMGDDEPTDEDPD